MSAEHQSLSQEVFADMGRRVQETTQEAEAKPVEEIESLCMNCHENGITKLLLTKIPFFREIVIMSFDCPHCGFHNSEIQPAGEIQPRGRKYTFKVDRAEDMSRQLVKSDTCIARIEDIDLEIPPGRGQLTNIEGIVTMIAQDLSQDQEERKEKVPEVYEKIEEVITTLKAMASGSRLPFTLTLDDPAGNSWVEPSPEDPRGKFTRHDYVRSPEQNQALGLAPDAGEAPAPAAAPLPMHRPEYKAREMFPEMPPERMVNNVDEEDIVENKVYSFPSSCPGCMKPCATNMKMVNIPHFKQVVLMSTVCDHCGYRSNEVKTGGEIPEKGRRLTLSVENKEDLSRDILKSESCALSCPELNLSVEPGTLGGRFTTVEGLLTNVRDDLHSSIFESEDSHGGDSMDSATKERWTKFFDKLNDAIEGRIKFTLILEDPLACSYLQSFKAPEPDEQIKVEDYERTEQEEEDLGLKDMKTEGYEEPAKDEEAAAEKQ